MAEGCTICAFWDEGRPEIFQFATTQWDIDKARRLIAAGKVNRGHIAVSDLIALMTFIRVDEAHALHLTPEQATTPIIMGWVRLGRDEFALPIDGWHRIARAGFDGRESVEAYLLTREQDRRLRTSHSLAPRDKMRAGR